MELTVYWTQFAEDKLEDVFVYYSEKASLRVESVMHKIFTHHNPSRLLFECFQIVFNIFFLPYTGCVIDDAIFLPEVSPENLCKSL